MEHPPNLHAPIVEVRFKVLWSYCGHVACLYLHVSDRGDVAQIL